ncbi:hypothetical protein [Kitasatospora sp. MAP5-34]|uniref:hypothetical protein n=1 Tax=Kitasatospora sp. MAP5-34 TaxID=3035102 RepID=UPI0024772530|nr:hypothetical protein [Kitasatospora sp. MAP5-34]MDH6579385.1 hypothetical protein [Kitasatospora sp. MAP5-34]
MHPTGPIARRFPLVARIRPACLPLEARVDKLCELADAGTRQADPGLASTVFNQAALLASDLGLPDYARELCRRHAHLYLNLGPLPPTSAIRGLEPVVNLARLHIRAGHHEQGHQLLLDLYQAVTTGAGTVLDGVTIPAHLTETHQQRAEVRKWLWRVVLADGTRALTTTGRWHDAMRHLQEHRGIGLRMLDGRQVAVLARATTGDTAGALALLEATEPGEPWENAVTAVLTALCRPGHQHTAATAIDHCLSLQPTAGLDLFTTRLALTAAEAASDDRGAAGGPLLDSLIRRMSESGDGYALREILAHPPARARLKPTEANALEQALHACALDSGELPEPTQAQLWEALGHATNVLESAPINRCTPGAGPA